MVDVRGDVSRPPHGTTPAAVKSNIKSEMRSFKSNESIHKKEGGSYYVVSANKAPPVTLKARLPRDRRTPGQLTLSQSKASAGYSCIPHWL